VRPIAVVALLIGVASLSGCVVVQTGVTNPIPGMTTVAVAPFVNLSAERSVDGRRFALAYHGELQKIPGYQVIPVGVVEQTLVDLGLDLDGPDDALVLARALGADAVVIGAVTDYDPYYPPRIGLQVSWYSPKPYQFVPGIPVDPQLGEAVRVWRFADRATKPVPIAARPQPNTFIRAQSPDDAGLAPTVLPNVGDRRPNPIQLAGIEIPAGGGSFLVPSSSETVSADASVRTAEVEQGTPDPEPVVAPTIPAPPAALPAPELAVPAAPAALPGLGPAAPTTSVPRPPMAAAEPFPSCDPRQPVMSYTRLFDGSDAALTALLRDYVVLSGDLRSGGWEAYLHRTEDFIRFTSHRMIVEMLTLHGGESKRRYVWLLNRERH
jgi:hypothetical protein